MRNSGATQLTERTMETSTTDLDSDAVAGISGALRQLLADIFVLYVKTKNFHWHMNGATFATTTCFWMNTPTRFSP